MNNLLEIKKTKEQGRRLCESVSAGLTRDQRRIVEGVYKTLEPLMEVQLTPDQITQLFGQVEQGATASGGNRTLVGKGVDAASAVNDTINKVGKWLQDTTPVQAFDQKFAQLKTTVSQKFPELEKQLTAMGTWAKENPGKTAAIIGVLTTLASLGGGPAGGAIAGQVLRGVTELLKGEKLSTAIGKGLKTAALGWMAGKTMDAIGDIIKDMAVDFDLVPVYGNSNYSRISVGIPGARNATEFGEIVGTNSEVNQFKDMFSQAADLWANDQYDQARDLFNQAYAFADKVTKATIAATGEDYSKPAENLANILKGLSAAAEGAAAGATAYDPQGKPVTEPTQGTQQPAATQAEGLTKDQVNALFEHIVIEAGLWDKFKDTVVGSPQQRAEFGQGVKQAAGWVAQKAQTVGKNITTKVTADKLQSAWKKAGSPTDSEAIADILTQQGIDPSVVNSAFQSVGVARIDKSKLPDISKLTLQQKQQLLAQLDALEKGVAAPAATTAPKTRTGGKVAGQVSQTPSAIRQRQARAAAKTATTPAQPAATLPGDRTTPMSQLLKQRQQQGMTEGYAEFKKKLNEELKR